MKHSTYYSLASLIKAGKKRARKKEIISFDLFDTLLIRRIHDPDLVKLPVARYISDLAKQQNIHKGWQTIQKMRDTIEREHRQETAKNFLKIMKPAIPYSCRSCFKRCSDPLLMNRCCKKSRIMKWRWKIPCWFRDRRWSTG